MGEKEQPFFNVPKIVVGPAGCGKSKFIRDMAQKEGKILLHCPCRKDRTLREGRQLLHTWAKRTDNSVIWLEGADDLTPESQAFLRRISETHSPQVSFVLECRNAAKLQEPIRSRYVVYRFLRPSLDYLLKVEPNIPDKLKEEIKNYLLPSEYSYRRIQQCVYLSEKSPEDWAKVINNRQIELNWNIRQTTYENTYKAGLNPRTLIELECKKGNNTRNLNKYDETVRNHGSIWSLLYSIALDEQ